MMSQGIEFVYAKKGYEHKMKRLWQMSQDLVDAPLVASSKRPLEGSAPQGGVQGLIVQAALEPLRHIKQKQTPKTIKNRKTNIYSLIE